MEPLFTSQTDVTYSVFRKCYNFIVFRKKRLYFGLLIIIAILLSIGLLTKLFGFYIAIGIVIILYFLMQRSMVKRHFQTYKKYGKIIYKYNFYQDYFESDSPISTISIEYNDLYHIYETKTRFYFMLSQKQAIIILKNNCSKELIDFLHIKKIERSKFNNDKKDN